MDGTEITAGRLHLRPWQPGDAAALREALADPEVGRWTGLPARPAQEWVTVTYPGRWADGSGAAFAVLDVVTGGLLGGVDLHAVDAAAGTAEVGWFSTAPARGRGVATEAVQVLCRWAFGAAGLHRLTAQVEVGNGASRAVAEKAGFRVEGVLRDAPAPGGRRADTWLAALLAVDEVRDQRRWGSWRDLPGEGLVLRQWRDDDVDAVHVALSDPDAARWLPVPSPYGRQDAAALVRAARERWATGQAAPLAVEQDGAVAGLVVLVPSPLDPGLAEVGWWTAPHARGRRTASRAVRVLVPWAQGQGVQRFEAGVDVGNAASQRTAEQAGFVREGVRRAGLRPSPRDGRRHDGVLYALVPLPGDLR